MLFRAERQLIWQGLIVRFLRRPLHFSFVPALAEWDPLFLFFFLILRKDMFPPPRQPVALGWISDLRLFNFFLFFEEGLMPPPPQ